MRLAALDADGTLPELYFRPIWLKQRIIDPEGNFAGLILKSTNQAVGDTTAVPLSIRDAANAQVVFIANTGRLQLGLGGGDTSHDAHVRFSLNVSPTQSVNIFQCTDGTDTLFSCSARGSFVMGANASGMDAVKRFQVLFTETQSVNVFEFARNTATIFRMQSNGGILIGGSSTATANNGFNKLIIQASSSETVDMFGINPGITNATNFAWNLRGVAVTGRIKTAVLFCDDNATPANNKLLGFAVTAITAGNTRTWAALDLSGNNVIVGDDPPAVAAGSLGKVDDTAQSADKTTTNLTNAPPTGDYAVMVYLQCTTLDAGAGTLTVTIGWTDTVGATTDTSITLALTATGRARGWIPVKVASGEITYAIAGGGTYGAARYAIDIRVIALG